MESPNDSVRLTKIDSKTDRFVLTPSAVVKNLLTQFLGESQYDYDDMRQEKRKTVIKLAEIDNNKFDFINYII